MKKADSLRLHLVFSLDSRRLCKKSLFNPSNLEAERGPSLRAGYRLARPNEDLPGDDVPMELWSRPLRGAREHLVDRQSTGGMLLIGDSEDWDRDSWDGDRLISMFTSNQ